MTRVQPVVVIPFTLYAILWVWVTLMCLVPLALFAAGPAWGFLGVLISATMIQGCRRHRARRVRR